MLALGVRIRSRLALYGRHHLDNGGDADRWLLLARLVRADVGPYYALWPAAPSPRCSSGGLRAWRASAEFPPARQPFSATEKRTLAVLALTTVFWLHGPGPPSFARHSRTAGRRPAAVTGHRRDQLEDVRATILMGAHPDRRDVAFPCTLMARSGAAGWLGNLLLAPLSGLAALPHALGRRPDPRRRDRAPGDHQPGRVRRPAAAINATIAASSGLNPVVTGLVLTIAVDAVDPLSGAGRRRT